MVKEIIVNVSEVNITKDRLRKKGYKIFGTINKMIGRVKILYGTGEFL